MGCGSCTETILSDGETGCLWFSDGGYCGNGCGMFGCGVDACPDEVVVPVSKGDDSADKVATEDNGDALVVDLGAIETETSTDPSTETLPNTSNGARNISTSSLLFLSG